MKAISIAILTAFAGTATLLGQPEVEVVVDGGGGVIGDIAGQFGVNVQTLVAQMINFALLATALYFLAVKPVTTTLDERQRKIADGLQYAEDMREQLRKAEVERAETIKQASLEAQKILAEARDQAKELLERKTTEAAAKAESMLKKANEAAEVERQRTLAEVRQEVARLVVATSSKVLAKELSDDDRKRFNESATRELASVDN